MRDQVIENEVYTVIFYDEGDEITMIYRPPLEELPVNIAPSTTLVGTKARFFRSDYEDMAPLDTDLKLRALWAIYGQAKQR